jgi:hypothetical protein
MVGLFVLVKTNFNNLAIKDIHEENKKLQVHNLQRTKWFIHSFFKSMLYDLVAAASKWGPLSHYLLLTSQIL